MAYGNLNPGPGDDSFADAEAPQSTRDTEEKSDEMGQTTLVPKSICPGMEFKPGEEMVLRVKRVLEDSYEMEYAPKESKEPESEPESAAPKGEGDAEMSSMMY